MGATKLSENKNVIAIIDDEPSVLRGLKRLLDASNFNTAVFDSGEAFLERGITSDITCIVLDIHLGGMSGIDMRRRLKAQGSTTPVIFMTALDSPEVRNQAANAGCAAYLPKPFSGAALIDAIRKATPSV
jgi:FixJ family two-component response regulator